jgi:hypothetical protein
LGDAGLAANMLAGVAGILAVSGMMDMQQMFAQAASLGKTGRSKC